MITAVFTENNDYAQVYGVWQWDYGQELRIQGLHLPAAVEIHFALQETGGEAVTRVGVTKDGITTVPIPDSMLEGTASSKDYQIYAWVYLADQVSGETIKRIKIQVRARPMPEAFEAPEDGEIFRQAIEAVNEAAKRAEDAGKEAVSSAGEAREAAAQAGKHLETVQGLADQAEINADTVAQDKQAVAGMLSQVQSAASEAALSAEAAKLSETAAGQAQTGAEAAEDGARQYAADTEAARQEVTSARQAVQQMCEAVAADKSEVEQTAAGFVDTARQAVSDVNAAGKAQVDAIKTAGQGASNAVETAKTTAVQAVTAEGDKQVQRVQEAAAGVEADREQINQNKADIAGLAEDITDLAPGIKITTTGTDITIKDAAEGRAFKGLRVFGRSEQGEGPSPETPQEMETAGESGNLGVAVSDGADRSQSLTLSTPNGLPGIPVSSGGNYTDAKGQQWVCDEIDLGRGKYVQRVAEKDVYTSQNKWDGKGLWGNNDNYNTLAFYSYINGTSGEKDWDAIKYCGLSNYFVITTNLFNTSVIGFSMGDYMPFRVPRSLLPDWDENNPSSEPWVNWLRKRKEAGNPLLIQYALKTPIERGLTPEEIAAYKALRAYSPTTVVSNDAGCHMETTYTADTKTYIDNKFAALNKTILDAVGGT